MGREHFRPLWLGWRRREGRIVVPLVYPFAVRTSGLVPVVVMQAQCVSSIAFIMRTL